MHTVDRETFETMVQQAVAGVPQAFRDRMLNLEFMVEDRATADDLDRAGVRGRGTLLGVYRGVPLPRRGRGYNMMLPDVIVLFQEPLQRMARDEEHLASLVEHTVRHEIAHYFGISDDRLRELGAY